jgi:hypothetical protein
MGLLKYTLSGLLLIVATQVISQTSERNKNDFTDLTPPGKCFDGYVYKLGLKYYVTDSADTFFRSLKITEKDIERLEVHLADTLSNNAKVEIAKGNVPHKYGKFKALVEVNLLKSPLGNH